MFPAPAWPSYNQIDGKTKRFCSFLREVIFIELHAGWGAWVTGAEEPGAIGRAPWALPGGPARDLSAKIG